MLHQSYNMYGKNEKEIDFWVNKKLEDLKRDIYETVDFYGLDNIDAIKVELNIFEKKENDTNC